MSEHTGPWTIEPHGEGYALYFGRTDRSHGMNVVHLVEPDWNWEVTKRKIETALNCHDELLAALKAIVAHQDLMGGDLARLSTTRAIAQSAIAKAEGK